MYLNTSLKTLKYAIYTFKTKYTRKQVPQLFFAGYLKVIPLKSQTWMRLTTGSKFLRRL